MIRPFEMKDLKRVLDIWLNTSIKAHPFITPNYFLTHYQTFQEDHLLRSQSQVYEIDGKIVGFVSIKQDMVITTVNVDQAYQRQGIGELLVSRLLNKFTQVSAKVYEENTNALKFFKALGFEVAGHEKHPDTKKDVVILFKSQVLTN